jgi:hypothetical protein
MSYIFYALSGFFELINKMFDWIRHKTSIEEGKKLKEAEIIKENEVIVKEQTEILIQDRTKDEVIDKMEKGTF